LKIVKRAPSNRAPVEGGQQTYPSACEPRRNARAQQAVVQVQLRNRKSWSVKRSGAELPPASSTADQARLHGTGAAMSAQGLSRRDKHAESLSIDGTALESRPFASVLDQVQAATYRPLRTYMKRRFLLAPPPQEQVPAIHLTIISHPCLGAARAQLPENRRRGGAGATVVRWQAATTILSRLHRSSNQERRRARSGGLISC